MNSLPRDITTTVRGLELLIAFRHSYESHGIPALVLSYFDTITDDWIPVTFSYCADYDLTHFPDGRPNDKNAAHQIHLIKTFVGHVNHNWKNIPFPEGGTPVTNPEEMSDKERFAAYIARVLSISSEGLEINDVELEKGW